MYRLIFVSLTKTRTGSCFPSIDGFFLPGTLVCTSSHGHQITLFFLLLSRGEPHVGL
jgi:hypothetical protein